MAGIILSGALGKMGRAIAAKAAESKDLEIIAGIDICESKDCNFPLYKKFSDLEPETIRKASAVIDFSNPAVFTDLLDFIVKNKMPVVEGTTGLNKEQVIKLKSAAYEVPVFYSGNMSLGVNLLCELSKKAAKALGNDFDIEIIEMHHNQKIDAPSGTALMIADAISAELGSDPTYEYDRHSKREKRTDNEIGIHSIRGGNITGEHQVIFAGNDEIITLSHSARSKTLFANGALNAARMIIGKENGLFSMKELIEG